MTRSHKDRLEVWAFREQRGSREIHCRAKARQWDAEFDKEVAEALDALRFGHTYDVHKEDAS